MMQAYYKVSNIVHLKGLSKWTSQTMLQKQTVERSCWKKNINVGQVIPAC